MPLNYKNEECYKTAFEVLSALNGYLNKRIHVKACENGWQAYGFDEFNICKPILNTYSEVSPEDSAGKVIKHYIGEI